MADRGGLVDELLALRARVAAAERVCVLFGPTASGGTQTDRDKATAQAWTQWAHRYAAVAHRPNAAEVERLAARWDIICNLTLMRIRGRRD